MGSLSLGVFGSEITDVRFMEKELVLLGCTLLDCRLCDMLLLQLLGDECARCILIFT